MKRFLIKYKEVGKRSYKTTGSKGRDKKEAVDRFLFRMVEQRKEVEIINVQEVKLPEK